MNNNQVRYLLRKTAIEYFNTCNTSLLFIDVMDKTNKLLGAYNITISLKNSIRIYYEKS